MDPVLGGEVEEGEKLIAVLGELLDRLGPLGLVVLGELVERPLRMLTVFGVTDSRRAPPARRAGPTWAGRS